MTLCKACFGFCQMSCLAGATLHFSARETASGPGIFHVPGNGIALRILASSRSAAGETSCLRPQLFVAGPRKNIGKVQLRVGCAVGELPKLIKEDCLEAERKAERTGGA